MSCPYILVYPISFLLWRPIFGSGPCSELQEVFYDILGWMHENRSSTDFKHICWKHVFERFLNIYTVITIRKWSNQCEDLVCSTFGLSSHPRYVFTIERDELHLKRSIHLSILMGVQLLNELSIHFSLSYIISIMKTYIRFRTLFRASRGILRYFGLDARKQVLDWF